MLFFYLRLELDQIIHNQTFEAFAAVFSAPIWITVSVWTIDKLRPTHKPHFGQTLKIQRENEQMNLRLELWTLEISFYINFRRCTLRVNLFNRNFVHSKPSHKWSWPKLKCLGLHNATLIHLCRMCWLLRWHFINF